MQRGHIESRSARHRRRPHDDPGHGRPDGESMSCRRRGLRRWARLSDEPASSPEQQAGQGDRRPVADADRLRPAAQGQDRRHLLRRSSSSSSWSRSSPALIANLFGVSHRDRSARESLGSTSATGLPPEGPAATTASTPTTRSASRPRTGSDNLAYWLYGCRTSLIIAGVATLFASTVVGVVARPGRRLRRRRRRPDHLLHHRPVPDHPVPAGRARRWRRSSTTGSAPTPTATRPIQFYIADRHPGRSSAGWAWPG